jgi:uncharacterized protein
MKNHLNSLIIAASIVLTAIIGAQAFKNRNAKNNTISVTGLASKDFVSDLIVWRGGFTRTNRNLKNAYAELDKDREGIRNYLIEKGIKPENIIFSAVNIEKEYKEIYNDNGDVIRTELEGYELKQMVQIESNEVDKVEEISRQVSELINSGIELYSDKPQYYYTKLAELKIQMIAEATKDANNRAARIAENAGSSLGDLKNASMGVFQIVAQNSSEEYSWGGAFNTSSKRKTANITVDLEYETE